MAQRILSVGMLGADIAALHESLSQQGVKLPESETGRNFFGPATRNAVLAVQHRNQLAPTGHVDPTTAAALLMTSADAAPVITSRPTASFGAVASNGGPAAGTTLGPAGSSLGVSGNAAMEGRFGAASVGGGGALGTGTAVAGTAFRVSGTIALEHGPAATQIKVRVYQRNFGGGKTLLGEAATDERGGYAVPYSAQGVPNVELYAVGADGAEVQLSRTKFGAATDEKLDLVAPTRVQPAGSEFSRLKAAVTPHLGSPEVLKVAVERGDQRDISVLSSKTQWDARALAFASLAYENAEATKMPADALYALHRVGFPTDLKALARVAPLSVTTALQQAAQAGIIDTALVNAGASAFSEFAANERLRFKPPGKLGSLSDFVARAPISESDRTAFTATLKEEVSNVWARAKELGVTDDAVASLRLQGQLAYLTLNNTDLVADLQPKLTAGDAKQLIDLDFDLAGTWVREVSALAANDDARLGQLVPPAIEGPTNVTRLQTYSEELARRVRQMDPHRVTIRHLARGDLDAVDANARPHVQTFLSNAGAKEYRLGQTPLGSFLATNPAETLLPDVSAEQRSVALDHVKALHRVYSVSTSDRTLNVLLKSGFRSARDVAYLRYDDFAALVGPQIGDVRETKQIYWKAQQVSATIINVFSGAKQLGSATGLSATGSTGAARSDRVAKAQEKLKGRFPTLESLFGSVDFCECEQCRSVLSPAAYLVDILHFIDAKEPQWTHQKALWSMAQADQNKKYEDTYQKPFDVLASRRPDIPLIALSCENTQTALPYIDIVNEILELLVVGGADNLVAFDTGEASSADLIAEPQNVTWEAYVGGNGKPGLDAAVFPTTLPFDLPLELVRAFLTQLGLPLWKLRLDVGRPRELFSALGAANGLADVWLERLGLGPADVKALLGKTPWYALYGYADEPTALAELTNAKTLSRRLGVTYTELVDLVKTSFVNPAIDNMVVVHALGVDLHDIERYFNPTASDALTAQERRAFETRLGACKVAPADVQALWTDAVRETALLLRSPNVDCDFGKTTLGFARPPANSEPALAFALLRLNTFVRLRRKLGWSTAELDAALRVFVRPAGSLSVATWADAMRTAWIYLAHLDEIAQRAQDRVSREELLLLWSPIATAGVSSLYERLFLGRGAMARDRAFESPLGRYLDGSELVRNHLEAIRQATGLSRDDIDQIFAAGAIQDGKLTIENLSLLLRHQVLARVLDLSVADLLVYLALSGKRPFAPLGAGPLQKLEDDVPFCQTLAFLGEIDVISDAGLNASSLDAICRHRGAAIEGEDWEVLADRLLVALSALPMPAATPPSPTPEQVAQQQQAAQRAQLAIVQTLSSQLAAPEPLTTTLVTNILRESSTGMPLIAESLTVRAGPLPTQGTTWAVYVWFAAAGAYKLVTSGGATATLRFGRGDDLGTITNNGGSFELAEVVAGERYRLELTLSAPGSLAVQGASPPTGVAVDAYQRFFTALARLRKVLDLLLALETTDVELGYLRGLPDALSLDALPLALVTDDAIARSTFASLTPWIDLTAARRHFAAGNRVVDVLMAARRTYDAPNQGNAFLAGVDAALSALTGWKTDAVQRARVAIGYAPKTTRPTTNWTLELQELTTGTGLRAMTDAVSALVRLGLNADDVVHWAQQPVDRVVATKLRAAVKGRYAPAAWRHVAQPLFDGLRKKQRDALVAFLTHLPDARYGETQEELFESLLFDPGTEPPVLASRIQLAISSVQLFLQRCLMSLEPQVASSIIDAKQWEWMSRYRVWEVNRKMFLWPENWLDSEFRDDKTHLFRELEGALLQGDVSDDLVRTSLYKYLTDFERIARLEMMTMYFEPGVSASGTTVHVIGRTQQAPYKYYYRSCSNRMWTPWEPLGIEIEGDHLALTVWRGRMHLFWVTFLERAETKSGSDDRNIMTMGDLKLSAPPPDTTVQLQLHWVEQIQGKWVNRSSTSTFVDAPGFRNLRASSPDEKSQFFVRVVVDPAGTDTTGDDRLELHISNGTLAHRFVLYSKLAPPSFDTYGAGPTVPPFRLPSRGSPQATKWVKDIASGGSGALQAAFSAEEIDTNGQVVRSDTGTFTILAQSGTYALLFPSNEIRLDETESIPHAAGTPSGYVFAPQGAQHVVYRAQDSNIHDLWWTPNGWFHSNASAAAQAEPATSDPHGYPLDEQYMQCVAYVSGKKLLELSWSQLDALGADANGDPTAGWHVDTLLDGSVDPTVIPEGKPLGGVFTPKRGVVVRTTDGALRAVVEGSSPGAWDVAQLIPDGASRAAGNPSGAVMTCTVGGVSTVLSRHVFYRGVDGHLHELRLNPSKAPSWTHTDVTAIASAPLPAAASNLATYAFLSQQSLHVIYRTEDGIIHELRATAAGVWTHNTIGASYGAAAGDPAGYVTESTGVQHVVYRGTDKHIHDLSCDAVGWRENVLTQTVSGAPTAASDPAAYSFASQNTQHVVYCEENGALRELASQPSPWYRLPYDSFWIAELYQQASGGLSGPNSWYLEQFQLAKPHLDPIGPLVAPFFFEDRDLPHTFFVEPSLAEQTIHTWEEYVVTTEEYVRNPIPFPAGVRPWFPELAEIAPSELGVIPTPPKRSDDLLHSEAFVGSRKGMFGATGAAPAIVGVQAAALGTRSVTRTAALGTQILASPSVFDSARGTTLTRNLNAALTKRVGDD